MNEPEFDTYAYKIAKNIVTKLYKDGNMTWRQAVSKNTNSRAMFTTLLKELKRPDTGIAIHFEILRNAEMIKTIPRNISGRVTEKIAKESMKGRRAEDILEDIKDMVPDLTESQAKRIARTETSKTSTALTKARCENMGLKWYIWRTSEDTRTRDSHRHMEDVLVCWDNPPNPEQLIGVKSTLGYYHAGDCPNCRCYPEVLISIDLISWPHKVYYNGSVVKMSRKQFEKITA